MSSDGTTATRYHAGVRRQIVPYLAFVASFMLCAWLLRGADEGPRLLASLVLALLVWWAVANRSRA